MKKETHTLINNIHRCFAVEFNNTAMDYFERENRTQEDIDDMIGYAHSALHHWKIFSGGTNANVQRGEYVIAKAYGLAGNKAEAISHAKRCFELTEKHPEEMKDFDFVFANEIMAFVNKSEGNEVEFKKYRAKAEKSGNEIRDEEDREFYFDVFNKYIKTY
ncbi:MAG: hypothetical protein M3R36_08250 [Bacteroidota bacterium]|nr:hypothetical protein [Bacteroidota bacterium]